MGHNPPQTQVPQCPVKPNGDDAAGGGSVRFNPNLYNCGKVCLSLLGTWSGAKGETWDPDSSSTLQVPSTPPLPPGPI